MAKYQTLAEFLHIPFGNTSAQSKISKYESIYAINKNNIILNAYTKINDSYYFHVKIPSESQKDNNMYYDVVIRFFSDKPSALISSHLRDYYIQFFSNSPGFIYNYAVLYKNKGYLIELLYTKLDPRYFDKLPEKTNSHLDLSYDKSIYLACRFLNDRKFKVLNKFGISLGKKLDSDNFFNEIRDFQHIKIENDLFSLEKKSLKDLSKTLEKEKSKETESNKNIVTKKTASLSTMKDKRDSRITKKTSTNSTSLVKSIIRKTAGKSTRKK